MQIQYIFSIDRAQQHLIGIQIEFKNRKKGKVDLVLPAWRPGRYERADFAANILDFQVQAGKRHLDFHKTDRDTWTVPNCPQGRIRVSYSYFADTINAGSSYVDEQQLYVNPVNCCMHIKGEMEAEVLATLSVPPEFRYSGMQPMVDGAIRCKDLDEWYDSPFVSSAHLIQHRFKASGIQFEVAVQGDVPYEKKRLESDFRKFIGIQKKAFKDCPVDRYTFLIQATPHRYYHGVEHEWGTTITLGPSRQLFKENIYEDLLAVSSHEFYHTWNVKYMRPESMWPYDFTQENYHRIGYIIEGVTTYQGDLKLWQGGAMSDELFLKEIKTHLDRHVANFGRFNHSVRESSFDTWVDGYGKSIPERRVSIYTEGALIAFILDVSIMRRTKGQKSLDTVMRRLYQQCKKKGRGYQEKDFLRYLEEILGKEAKRIYAQLIDRAVGYEKELEKALQRIGIKYSKQKIDILASDYGIRTDSSDRPKVIGVHPESMAYEAGVRPGMQILGIDGQYVEGDADALITRNELSLLLKSRKMLIVKELRPSDDMLYYQYELEFSRGSGAYWKRWKKGIF
ncbi:MAG: M61 family metallopeptidase [Flavobacteriales bacterium]|nr:M61 family metallopeptidase [Flavobacteriales bacterium]